LFLVAFVVAAVLQAAPAPIRTVGKGPMSAIETARQVTVRSADEWAALWKENGAQAPLPAVDFSREIVLGVFAGTRPTAGYGIEIVRAVGTTETLVIEYIETAPSRGAITAQVLTSPYHLVAIPRHDGSISFKKVDK